MKEFGSRAWLTGGASAEASRRFDNAVDRLAPKFEAHFKDDIATPDPTDLELKELRNRYIEHKAFEERSKTLWSLVHEDWRGELVGIVAMLIYRVVVFAAAVAMLYHLLRMQ